MEQKQQKTALIASTVSFSACFAVWTIFSIIGIGIKNKLNLTNTEFGILIATPILSGSFSRLALGIWASQYGGKIIFTSLMIITSISTWFLSYATSYKMYLLAALCVGLAGGSFAVGITYVSSWYKKEQQGTALGIFGLGNLGAGITNILAPILVTQFGAVLTVRIYSVALFIIAILFCLIVETDPITKKHKKIKKEIKFFDQLKPLNNMQVWRFSSYYFFVFGGFVALALWLPRYYMEVYNLDIKLAGALTFTFSISGSIFRAYGGWLSDKYGARKVMYCTFIVGAFSLFIMSYPNTHYVIHGINRDISFSAQINLIPFIALTILLGFFMSLGKAAVYKHIPIYYPDNIGSVGGLVALVGGLGGCILPIVFGIINDLTQIWTSCFMVLFLVNSIILLPLMHFAIKSLEKGNPAKS